VIRSLARLTAAVLIVASAAAFATGAALERHSEAAGHAAERTVATSPASPGPASPDRDTGQEPSGTAAGPDGDSGHDQASAAAPPASSPPDSDHAPGAGREAGQAPAAAEAQEHPEVLFGINPESAGLVAAAVAVSVLLAAAILILGMPWLAGMIAAAMLAFTALDIREILFQAGRSHSGLAAAAAAVALLHLLAALAAALVARTGPARRHGATANHT
jgi:hypothetical protein